MSRMSARKQVEYTRQWLERAFHLLLSQGEVFAAHSLHYEVLEKNI